MTTPKRSRKIRQLGYGLVEAAKATEALSRAMAPRRRPWHPDDANHVLSILGTLASLGRGRF